MNWRARLFRNFFSKHPDVYVQETVTAAPHDTDRELFITDLCQRLPYKVVCYAPDHEYGETGILCSVDLFGNTDPNIYIQYPKGNVLSFFPSEIKPYLRPMSDMTEEEHKELADLINDESLLTGDPAQTVCLHCGVVIDFHNAHHLDWRGLIPRNLAIEAPEGMYNN